MKSACNSAAKRLQIVILGYIIRCPLGGLAWHYLQYAMGLARLGHVVYYVEDSDDCQWSCYDPTRDISDTDPTYGLEFAKNVFDRVGLGDHWAYYDAHKSRWHGPTASRVSEICTSADLLINISGINPLRPWLMEIPARALVDSDPGFTQIRHLTLPEVRSRALQHTAFFSFGANIGRSGCSIPRDGLPWQATRQPVVLDAWPVTPGLAQGKFTTVMQWESYPPKEYEGLRYGMKSDSFGPYLDLPERVGSTLEMAVGGPSAPRQLLNTKGWVVRGPLELSRTPWTYQQYIQQSKAEFTVARHGYVITHSGQFNDRSAVYLASGRPIVIQDTGFSDWLETGSGVMPFNNPEEAQFGIEEINRRYEYHCLAARAIAEEYFDAGKVLSNLVECIMNPGPVPTADSSEET